MNELGMIVNLRKPEAVNIVRRMLHVSEPMNATREASTRITAAYRPASYMKSSCYNSNSSINPLEQNNHE